MKNLLSKVAIMSSIFLATSAFATQTIEVGNMLYNQDASAPGVTQTSITVKFYTGSSVLCDTKVVAFGSAVTVIPGTTGTNVGATACTSSQSITSVTATPATTNATIGAVYGTSAISQSITDTNTITQLLVVQEPDSLTAYAPIFSTSNGTVTTAGVPVFTSQAAFRIELPRK